MKKILTLMLIMILYKSEAQTSVQAVNCVGHNFYVRVTFSDSTAIEFFPSIITCPDNIPHFDTAETVFKRCKMELFSDAACTQGVPVDPRFFAFDPVTPNTAGNGAPFVTYKNDCADTVPAGSAHYGNYRIDYYPWYLRRCIYECVPTPMHQCFSNNPGTVYYNLVINCCFVPRVLSVQILDFRGQRNGGINKLSWLLGGDADLSRLELERSFDGNSYSPVYTSTDANITAYVESVNKTAYYRLQLFNRNNTALLSPVIVLKEDPAHSFSVFPSPFADQLNIAVSVPNNTPAIFRLFSADGQIVFSASRNLVRGVNNFSFKVAAISAGVYLMQMSTADRTQSKKIVKH